MAVTALMRAGRDGSEAAWKDSVEPWPPVLTKAPPTRRQRLRQAFETVANRVWLDRAYVRWRRVAGAVILMYHSVATTEEAAWIDPANHLPPEVFDAHLAYLASHYQIVALEDIVAAVETGRTLPARTVALTFDDGYLDNLTEVAPRLARWGFPATLFLPTAYVTAGAPQWIDVQFSAFRARTRAKLRWPPASGAMFDLCVPEEQWTAYQVVAADLLGMDWEARESALRELRAQLGVTVVPPPLTMNWNDVRTLRRKYPAFELGVHTRQHLDLAQHTSQATAEVSSCCDEFERALGMRPRFIAYPYNRTSPAAIAAVRAAGLRAGVAGEGTAEVPAIPIRAGSDPWVLPRVAAPVSVARLGYVASGAHPGLWHALRGRC